MKILNIISVIMAAIMSAAVPALYAKSYQALINGISCNSIETNMHWANSQQVELAQVQKLLQDFKTLPPGMVITPPDALDNILNITSTNTTNMTFYCTDEKLPKMVTFYFTYDQDQNTVQTPDITISVDTSKIKIPTNPPLPPPPPPIPTQK